MPRAHGDGAPRRHPGHGCRRPHLERPRDGGARRGRHAARARSRTLAGAGHDAVRDPAFRIAGADAASGPPGFRSRGRGDLPSLGPRGLGHRAGHGRRDVSRALAGPGGVWAAGGGAHPVSAGIPASRGGAGSARAAAALRPRRRPRACGPDRRAAPAPREPEPLLARVGVALGTPVVSGNVSFYNETEGHGSPPTPMLAMVGLLDDVEAHLTPWWKAEGDVIVLLGRTREELGASEYLAIVHGLVRGAPPWIDLETEQRLQRLCLAAAAQHLLRSAHDAAERGLGVA